VTSRQFHLHNGQKGAALAIRIISRARRREIAEVLSDGTVTVRLTSVLEEKKANTELVEFLSEIFGVPPSRIDIVAGEEGRDKLVTILDLDADMVNERIMKYIAPS
jgi:uncharacterized protein (TIGR00251 family)